MKRIYSIAIALILISSGNIIAYDNEATKEPSTFLERLSYSFGYEWGNGMKHDSIYLDMSYIIRGLKDGQSDDSTSLMTKEEMQAAFDEFQEFVAKREKELQKRKMEEMMALGEKFKEEGPKFLEENKKKEGVKVHDSGLQYEIIQEGHGQPADSNDAVMLRVHGEYFDGTVFDDSYDQRPFRVEMSNPNLIDGWKIALPMMKEGSTWIIYLPPDLAYGQIGLSSYVPPNAVLVYKITILEIIRDEN